MKAPAFQFYPGDWLKEPGVRACSLAARGLWIEVLCFMNESPVRGELRFGSNHPITATDLAQMVAATTEVAERLLGELERAGVFSRADDGAIVSRRMVKDEQKRREAAEQGRTGGNPSLKGGDKAKGNTRVNRGVAGPDKGGVNPPLKGGVALAGASSSSSSSSSSTSVETPLPPETGGGQTGFTADRIPFDPKPKPEPPDDSMPHGSEIVRPDTFDELLAEWKLAGLPGGDAMRETHTRRGLFEQRQGEADWRRDWRAAVKRLGKSSKARGNDPAWPRGVWLTEFLQKPDFVQRVLEGEFDDSSTPAAVGGNRIQSAVDEAKRRLKEQEAKRG